MRLLIQELYLFNYLNILLVQITILLFLSTYLLENIQIKIEKNLYKYTIIVKISKDKDVSYIKIAFIYN